MPSITDSIGRVLGDRYRLVSALGTGASSHVYVADDVSLHRRVAIKVLHPSLTGDASFLRRFRAEARAVAALNHPNILKVYDWGEDGDAPYLVLEYLSGGSLRQVLDAYSPLAPEQAVAIGIEAAAGLEYAHRRGLVHRDIKPANLLFDDDARLRIADFGLARALAEAAWTEPQGTMLGTVRYASPEQAQALPLDGRADVYALALVLYEAVTGALPFVGETTLATLMARVGALLPEHPALGSGLYDVLVWAAAPEASERIDAGQLGRRLEALAATLPSPAPLPLVTGEPEGDGELDLDRHPPAEHAEARTQLGEPAAVDGRRPATAAAPPAARRRWPWVATVVALVAVLAAIGVTYAVANRVFTPSHPVADLVGRTVPAARAAVRPDGFSVRQTATSFSTTVAAGIILAQTPAAATPGRPPVTAKQGTVIDVVVSRGPPPVTIPALTTFTSCNDAVAALAALHLVGVCPASAQQYSTAPVGAVLGSTPTGTAPYGSTVTIATSKGRAPVTVPAVAGAGTTYPAAVTALQAAGFVVVRHNQYDAAVPSGAIISSSPDPSSGPQPYGSTVTVNVSLGPKPVPVPFVLGQSVASAKAQLKAQGLKVAGPYGPPGGDTVITTDPLPGTQVVPGTTVTLYTI